MKKTFLRFAVVAFMTGLLMLVSAMPIFAAERPGASRAVTVGMALDCVHIGPAAYAYAIAHGLCGAPRAQMSSQISGSVPDD